MENVSCSTKAKYYCYQYICLIVAILFPIIYGISRHITHDNQVYPINIIAEQQRQLPYSYSINITITGKNITYDNQPIQGSQLYLLPGSEGLMLKSDDLKVWTSEIKFYSLPINRNSTQQWFTKEHKHGSKYWAQGLNSLPIYSYFFPVTKNPFVNTTNTLQKEGGVKWTCIDATNNTGNTTFQIKAVADVWSVTGGDFWLEFFELQIVFALIIVYRNVVDCLYYPIETYHGKKTYGQIIRMCFNVFILVYTLIKDVKYLNSYPHFNGISAGVFAYCLTGIMYDYWVKACGQCGYQFLNLLFCADIEGHQRHQIAKYLAWEMNVWLILAMIYDMFNFGYKPNFFQQSSLLISSISIAQGHSQYVVQLLIDYGTPSCKKSLWRRMIVQTIFYILLYLYIILNNFVWSQSFLLKEDFFNHDTVLVKQLKKVFPIALIFTLIIAVLYYTPFYKARNKPPLEEMKKLKEMMDEEEDKLKNLEEMEIEGNDNEDYEIEGQKSFLKTREAKILLAIYNMVRDPHCTHNLWIRDMEQEGRDLNSGDDLNLKCSTVSQYSMDVGVFRRNQYIWVHLLPFRKLHDLIETIQHLEHEEKEYLKLKVAKLEAEIAGEENYNEESDREHNGEANEEPDEEPDGLYYELKDFLQSRINVYEAQHQEVENQEENKKIELADEMKAPLLNHNLEN